VLLELQVERRLDNSGGDFRCAVKIALGAPPGLGGLSNRVLHVREDERVV
jgi:hypothetical protein